jgi:hypothetical protein
MAAIVVPRGELGSAQITSMQTTTSLTAVDVPGATTTVTAGTRPLLIEFDGMVSHSTAAKQLQINLLEDGVQINQLNCTGVNAGAFIPVTMKARRVPAAGSHTYKLQFFAVDAGTITVAGGATFPGLLEVTEV